MGELVKLEDRRAGSTLRLAKDVTLDLKDPSVKADGLRAWIGGESGAGKSWANALIAEQVIAAKQQLVILDSHGEYQDLWALDPVNIVRIGYGDEPVNEASAEWLCQLLESGKSLLIDLSHWTDINPVALDRFAFEFMTSLYALRRKAPKRMMVIVEECQAYIPQMMSAGQADNVRIFLGILTGGRKYGINCVLSSQQQVLVDVRAIAACNVRLFLRTNDHKEFMKKVKPHMGTVKISFDGKKDGIKLFRNGEAILTSRWTGSRRVQLLEPEVKPTKMLASEE